MSWFCHKSSHKRSKTKVGSATPAAANDRMCFAVVLQDFEASVSDELSIRRGVLVEMLYKEGNWQYVRDMDGRCGYVPNNFCYDLGQIQLNQWNLKEGRNTLVPRPRPKSIQVNELPLAASSQSLGENFSRNQPLDTTTPSQTESCQTTTLDRLSGTVRRLTPAVVDNSERSLGNAASSEQASSASQVLNSSKDFPTSVRTETVQTRTDLRAASCSSQLGRSVKREPCRPSLHRAFSYQEAVIKADENLYGLTAGIKPSDLETAPANQQEERREEGDRFDTLESFQSGVSHISECNLTDMDEVFLPENKKPLGIYHCLTSYSPQFKGEIPLQENELVIMLEKGRGEWAWVLTSTNVEGLVPKHILVKYHHHPGMRISSCADSQTSIGTQTELIVTTPLVKQICSSPVSARGTTASERSPTSKSSPHKRHRARKREDPEMKQTATVDAAAAQTDCLETPWFDTTDSRDRTPLPELDSTTPPRDTTACVQSTPSLAQSAPPKLSSRSRLRLNLKDSPTQGHHSVVRAIDFEAENDTMNTLSSQRKFRQTPVLCAVRNYDPPVNAKNCLSLTKGDILHTQPHMHYPKGWMWVWHSTQKTFGYVPRSSVAFMYLVQKKSRRQLDSTEDAV